MEELQAEDPRDVPDYEAVLALDMRGYSKAASHLMSPMRTNLDAMVAAAMAESGLAEEWQQRKYWGDRGDGFLLAMPVRRLWRLVDPLPEKLEAALAAYDAQRRAADPEIRVRMSVHVGPLPSDYHGDPMNDACRLLDSGAARSALEQAKKLDSFLTLIISDAVFHAVVRAKRTLRLTASDFLRVRAEVDDKFAELAWVHVPRRSPNDLAGLETPAPVEPVAEPSAEAVVPTVQPASKYHFGQTGSVTTEPSGTVNVYQDGQRP
ncbi:hypothetical protein OG500_35370 [Kitasatospora sp. NBC_01250]|uniref:hypothetical protein n=1 Tax=unclassified Kitasatospora TaxID=2633591 RepID=UPI002E14F845|nr:MULTISPECIES: hypothetical protein [unclassified Kitasatospora]WSJ71227.1 hypothetical protein OG294_36875 [Kitasatospora sp. NBC_01302]